jgi:hypothetical protein
MDLFLQVGHGMMGHCRHLIESWGGGTVLISPRDLTADQIQRFGQSIVELGGNTLVDPQFYDPRSTHHRLVGHDYWPDNFQTSMLSNGPQLSQLLQNLLVLNESANSDQFIIPGIYGDRVDDDWLAIQDNVINEAVELDDNRPKIATICISGEAMRFEEQIEIVINSSEKWEVDGFYIVPEHPGSQYLVEDPVWLSNLMNLCAGLKLHGKRVIVGYSSHQMLSLATCKLDAIASGTWLNVRSFSTRKFQESDDDEISRRVKWYYCPHALSEYKIPFLDMAHRAGILHRLRPDEGLESQYAETLFTGAQPTLTDYTEQQSHRHYLQCLFQQCRNSKYSTFRDTMDYQEELLNIAESYLDEFHRVGVRGQDRDFGDIIDVNRAALAALNSSRGFVLERLW